MKKIQFRKLRTNSCMICYEIRDDTTKTVLGTLNKGSHWTPSKSLLEHCNLTRYYHDWARTPLRKPRTFNEVKIVLRHFLNHPYVHLEHLSDEENRFQVVSSIRHMIDVDQIRKNARRNQGFQSGSGKPVLEFQDYSPPGSSINHMINVLQQGKIIGQIYSVPKSPRGTEGAPEYFYILNPMLQKNLGVWGVACYGLRLPLEHAKALCQFLEKFPYDIHRYDNREHSIPDHARWLKQASIDYLEIYERKDIPKSHVYFRENPLCNSVLAYTGEEMLISLHKNEINGTWRWGQGPFQGLHADEYLTPTNLSRARAILERSLFGSPIPQELDRLAVL